MADLKITGLHKRYGHVPAVRGIDLEVPSGEFTVLVGPSGCGKSTLLRTIAGLEEAQEGTIEIGGRVVNHMRPRDRDIAMVFQNYALYPFMNVFENIAFGLRARKTPAAEIETRVRRAADMLGITSLLDRLPRQLSGGQRQRVAIGRAMVRHPKVFLMDEPLSNLDAKLRVAMRGELIRLHQQYRTTTMYVTHDQVEAMTLGDRIAVLNAGVLQQVGTPDELYRAPCNVFVAGFIGSPAMNLASATLSPDMVLGLGRYRWPLPDSVLHTRPHLRDMAGHTLVIGVRPHALDLAPDTDPAAPGIIAVTAVSVESLGSEKNVLFLPPFDVPQVADNAAAAESELATMWTANVDPDATVNTGQRIALRLDLDAAYFFDARTGLAVPQLVPAGTA